jgi:O-acetyl-ADP-ribose deacetylase (regulator of RNase III)
MIHYLLGDATLPTGAGPKIIAHVCNDVGGWGAGFVLAVSRRWRKPETSYRRWYRDGSYPNVSGKNWNFELGRVQFICVGEDVYVANMLAQKGYGSASVDQHRTENFSVPLRYDALSTCLSLVDAEAGRRGASVHMPRIGCGLAGGTWDRVEPIIQSALSSRDVFVYDLGAT